MTQLTQEELIRKIEKLVADGNKDQIGTPNRQDKGSHVEVPFTTAYMADNVGTPHAFSDTDGFMKVEAFPGTVVYAAGTFTKDATGTTGTVSILAPSPEELKLLYGSITIGGVRATETGDLLVDINTPGDLLITRIAREEAVVVRNTVFFLPTPGTAFAAGNQAVSSNPDQMRIGPGARIKISLLTMANAETFLFSFAFVSNLGFNPNLTSTDGVIS